MPKIDIDKRMKGKRNTNGFDKNPGNRNSSGRPRKTVSIVLKGMKENGIHPVSQDEIKDIYLSLVNNTSQEIDAIENDPEQPMLTKLVIKAMKEGRGIDVLEKMFDRAIGKAQENIKHEVKEMSLSKEELDDISNIIDE